MPSHEPSARGVASYLVVGALSWERGRLSIVKAGKLHLLTDQAIDRIVNSEPQPQNGETSRAIRDRGTWVALRAYAENRDWFEEKRSEIKRLHRGLIVGVLDREVWLATKDADEFRLRLSAEARMAHVYVRYVPGENEVSL